jgi:hypothetical protein
MFDRLRKALFGERGGEVLGGRASDDTSFTSGGSLGGTGAVSEHHGPRGDDNSVAGAPKHGDDEFSPRVPPDA